MRVLIDNIPASRGFHSGGALAFGPDDKLYITVGDATEHEYAQDPATLLGKTLRINRDGTIPKDNPFPNSPVYTLGHRNTFGVAFDWSTGLGILTENGDQAYDEVNLIEKGGNYGFPLYQ
jgi:glucose/arabinose dehydrogenase